MMLDESFDADEVLRDVDEAHAEEDLSFFDDMRELNFGSRQDENANFNEMAGELDTTGDMWE